MIGLAKEMNVLAGWEETHGGETFHAVIWENGDAIAYAVYTSTGELVYNAKAKFGAADVAEKWAKDVATMRYGI